MPIDNTKPVYLKKMIVDGQSGNTYPAFPDRAYPPGSLPERYLTEEYCSQEGVLHPPQSSTTELRMQNSLDPVINLGRIQPEITQAPVIRIQPPDTSGLEDLPPPPRININQADKSVIEALDGVGGKTLDKLIAERDIQPFTAIEQLDERVPLSFGKKWATLADTIEF